MSTKGYGGRQVAKRIVIQTNDPQKQSLTLVVKGSVKKFVTIRPKRVQLTGASDEEIRQTVAIIPEKEYPFNIIETTAKQGDDIKFALEEKQGDTGTEYQLTVENTRRQAGRYYDIIVLKTDNELKPELQVRVYGNIIEPKGENKPVSESAPKKPVFDQEPAVKAVPSKKGASGGVKIDKSVESETGSKTQ